MKTEASCFDLDHTLLRVNSSYQFGIYLYRQQFFSFPKMLFLAGCYWLHKCALLSMPRMQQKIFDSLFKGKPESIIKEHARHFIQENIQRFLYLPAVQKLKQAQDNGHYTAILSSTPSFLVEAIAKYFQVDDWGATRYSTDTHQNFLTIETLWESKNKIQYMNTLSQRLGIPPQSITAYADNMLDLPFLQAAGHAVGVNPTPALAAICRQKQWPII